MADENTDTVFIATRHDSHGSYVEEALRAGNNVFVEKPLCMNATELQQILNARNEQELALMVGFNRRFSPHAEQVKSIIGDGPLSMMYRINAGAIPADSWIQDAEMGGGRIVGEVCHFIDLMVYTCGALPVRAHAHALPDPANLQDTVTINLQFENGSIGSICYFANGAKALAKEYFEVFKAGLVARITDFKELEIVGTRKPVRKKLMSQDKGQKKMVAAFLAAVAAGQPCPIPLRESVATTLATFAVLESIRTGEAIDINR